MLRTIILTISKSLYNANIYIYNIYISISYLINTYIQFKFRKVFYH